MGLETAALATAAIGTAVGAASAISQGQAAQQAAQFNAQIAAQNANASMAASANAASLAAIQTQQKEAQFRRAEGAQRAGFLRAGITMAGSPTDVLSDTATEGHLQAASTEYAGLTESYNFRLAAAGLSGQSSLDKASGDNAALSGFVNAGSSLLQGGGNALAIAANPNFSATGAGNRPYVGPNPGGSGVSIEGT